jgi:hypothetical protein
VDSEFFMLKLEHEFFYKEDIIRALSVSGLMVKAPEDIEEVVIRANSVMFLAISEARFRYIDPPPKE